METTTPFDLNQAIQEWRRKLATSPALNKNALDELESHLRDSMLTLEAKGLSADEIFLIAARRCGNRHQLHVEFSKLNLGEIWFFRVSWIILGCAALLDAIYFIQIEAPPLWILSPLRDLHRVAMITLAISCLNTYLLRQTIRTGSQTASSRTTNRILFMMLAGNLVVLAAITFVVFCSMWLVDESSGNYIMELSLSGIWLSYGFLAAQLLLVAPLLAIALKRVLACSARNGVARTV